LIARQIVNSRHFILTLYVLLFAGLGTGGGILFEDAREEYQQLKLTEAKNRQLLAEAEARLAAQEEILRRLQTDPVYLEKVLRRNGYTKPEEYIFVYPE